MRIAQALAAAFLLLIPSAVTAADSRPSLLNDFQLGGANGGIFCRVQSSGVDPALESVFDRAWSIVCPDAADAVGRIYALRTSPELALSRLERLRARRVTCQDKMALVTIEDLRSVDHRDCSLAESDVAYEIYRVTKGSVTYVVEGLTGYDSALRLALRSIVNDTITPGELDLAITGAGDPVAFARVQAGTQDPARALEEAYRRNNAGSYAEAAEFFAALLERTGSDKTREQYAGEILINQALQKSNLGIWKEADLLFTQADAIATDDPVQLRLRRNFKALHLLNQGEFEAARVVLAHPLQGSQSNRYGTDLVITPAAAAGINSTDPVIKRLSGSQTPLTPEERSRILDDQAIILGAVVDRVQGRLDSGELAIKTGLADLDQIRGGRVTSVARLRAQGLSELALIFEQRGDQVRAESNLREAVDLLAYEYPGSLAVASVNSRLAGFLARQGRADEALAIFREILAQASEQLTANNRSADLLAPYFAILAQRMDQRPELAADFFLASETLVRPGVAQTQAILARQFSGGADEASNLFRQAVALARDVERTRVELARVRAAEQTEDARAEAEALQSTLTRYQQAQAATQAKLAQVPRFRAVNSGAMSLTELQATLRDGEAYYKLTKVGPALYASFITTGTARVWRLPITAIELEGAVQSLRDSVVVEQGGQYITYPFDVEAAVELYQSLFKPVTSELSAVQHLIFEPDGAMLRLPPNLLIEDEASADAYLHRINNPKEDQYDMRGIAWFGRNRDISTATSAKAFRDLRTIPPSSAKHEYLGFGDNAPVGKVLPPSAVRAAAFGNNCAWGPATWNRPISPEELQTARAAIFARDGDQGAVLTGNAFTDTAILQKEDLAQYRIVHFATHGLVTPPQAGCSTNPALVTSFGEGDSDGLLSFAEIFNLNLDADLIILSACDTAGEAGAGATAEAGLTTGGQSELDGLVRAFVGAGGRLVVASHWPVPDAFGATEKLISGLFNAPAGTSTAAALRTAQNVLMSTPDTSHPYYWSGFALIGDGSSPVLRPKQGEVALANAAR